MSRGVKCCGEVFGAASNREEAEEIGFEWWFRQWHDHRAHDWTYEVVTGHWSGSSVWKSG